MNNVDTITKTTVLLRGKPSEKLNKRTHRFVANMYFKNINFQRCTVRTCVAYTSTS